MHVIMSHCLTWPRSDGFAQTLDLDLAERGKLTVMSVFVAISHLGHDHPW